MSLLKYVWIAIFFLVLGGETMMSNTARSAAINAISGKEGNRVELSGAWETSGDVYASVLDTFSSIRQVETFKLTSSGQEREVVRIVRTSPSVDSTPSAQNVVEHNFIHVLTGRHCHGFYLYTLKKLII